MKLTPIDSSQPDEVQNSTQADTSSVVVQAPTTNSIVEAPVHTGTILFKAPTTIETPKGVEQATQIADKLVGEAFGQAVLYTAQTDEETQDKLLSTAKQVIKDKTDSIADMASTERTAKFFEKNADACQYFGYDEKTTNQFHVKVMAVWAFILNSIYIFTIGFFVVSPITFILKKITVVIKKTWVAFLLALFIYLLVICIPILVSYLSKVIPQ